MRTVKLVFVFVMLGSFASAHADESQDKRSEKRLSPPPIDKTVHDILPMGENKTEFTGVLFRSSPSTWAVPPVQAGRNKKSVDMIP